ncbi:MAG: hypothetical protein WBG95_10475 [Sulfitobacter sp.]
MTDLTDNKTLYAHIGARGWKAGRSDGEWRATFAFSDRLVTLDGGISHNLHGFSTDLSAYVSYPDLSRMVDAILAATHKLPRQTIPLAANHGLNLRGSPQMTVGNIDDILDTALAWAREQDIETALMTCRTIQDHPRAVDHLAALALVGDVDRLRAYEYGYRDGVPSPFLPYVTIANVTRARELAEART